MRTMIEKIEVWCAPTVCSSLGRVLMMTYNPGDEIKENVSGSMTRAGIERQPRLPPFHFIESKDAAVPRHSTCQANV